MLVEQPLARSEASLQPQHPGGSIWTQTVVSMVLEAEKADGSESGLWKGRVEQKSPVLCCLDGRVVHGSSVHGEAMLHLGSDPVQVFPNQ